MMMNDKIFFILRNKKKNYKYFLFFYREVKNLILHYTIYLSNPPSPPALYNEKYTTEYRVPIQSNVS